MIPRRSGRTRQAYRWTTKKGVVNLFLFGVAALAIYPFLVMAFDGFKTGGELSTNPAGIPISPTLDNFRILFTGQVGALMWRSLLNSVVITIPYTALTVLFCSMAGYAFAKYAFPAKNIIFALLIASMLVPAEVNLPSLYIAFSKIGWLNTYQVQILPGTASVLGMFMVRQFMSSLPTEVLEAARLDGSGHWRTFWQIVLPMSTPVLGAVAILMAVNKWSDYVWPRVLINKPQFEPVMVLLPQLSTATGGFIVLYEVLLAGATIITLPILLVFLRYQDKLMSGTTVGAVRG